MNLQKSIKVTMRRYNSMLQKLERVVYSPSEILHMRANMFKLLYRRKPKAVT